MTRGPPIAKTRKLYRFSGFGANIRYGVHNHSLGNVRRGIVERVFMVERQGFLEPTPKPTPKCFEQLSRFNKVLGTHLPKLTRLTPEEFLGFYKGQKLVRYQKAVESLEIQAIEPKDAWLKTFVKAEKLNISAKPDPAPRVIQPREPRYNVELGRYLRHAEEHLFKAIDRVYGGRTVFKSINADDAGIEMKNIWDSFRCPVAIGMDASRFDQHVSVDALKMEHNMWLSMFPVSERPHLRKLLKWQLKNKGLARCPDGSVRYEVDGCRMSGDMNTSSGNCYIMCCTVYEWCKRKGITKFRLANNGDDCVLFVESRDLARAMVGLGQYYRDLGFTMKVEKPVFTLEEVEFCQTHPVLVGDNYRMVRNLHTGIAKDLHCLLNLDNVEDLEAWVDAVGAGGRMLNDGVPVLSSFFKQFPSSDHLSSVREKVAEYHRYRFYRKGKFTDSLPTPESRFSFWLAFGVTPDEQMALEEGFSPLNISRVLESGEEFSLLHFSRA